MKKTLLIPALSLLAIAISSSVLVQRAETLTVGGLPIYQEDWEKKYYELWAKYAELNATYNKLRTDFDTLVNSIVPQVESLRSSLAKMKSDIDKMRSDLEASTTAYKTLEVKYESALRELSTRTTMMYAFIVTTVVFLATTLYLALRKPKAKT